VRGLLDTSVFIASEQNRQLERDQLPDEAAISVVTLAELELGVHMAAGEAARSRRLRTLMAANATYAALPIDTEVAAAFARLVAVARQAGVLAKTQDVWIAATALVHAVPVYTQDTDFDALSGIVVIRV
jgi:predicted nucleic acid-binding protein